MQITKKKLIGIAILSALIILIIILIRSCSSSKNVVLEYDKVSKGDINKTISVSGTLNVLDSQRILSKIEGIVNTINVDFNVWVKKGQLLATMDSTEIQQRLMKAQTQLESARLELEGAQNDLEGKKKMFAENLISRQALDQAELKYKSAFYEHRRIQIDCNHMQNQLNSTRIYSPISGIILSIDVMPKMAVSENTLMFQIVPSLNEMLLVINIDESDIGNVRVGQNVVFYVSAFPEKKFNGKITQVRINPVNIGGLVTYQSLVVCTNPDQILKPGMTATATVEVANRKNVLRVPNQALLIAPPGEKADPDKKVIWIKTAVGHKKQEVRLGLVGDMYSEVTANLNTGEKILVGIKESGD